jgi:LuxR family maltose regulon positive regulatory protein
LEISLLKTKVHIPKTRSDLVRRVRLQEMLSANQKRKLTLISAPAGFGKTTLLSDWLQGVKRSVAWISLDRGDNDLTRFLSYVVMALQGIQGGFGISILEMIHSPKPPPMDSILVSLINTVTELFDPFYLILDDYHVITERAVHEAIIFLVDHLPPSMQMVLSSRSDPPWPIARLRARGELLELSAKDLRFTHQEARQFLTRVMGFDLKEDELKALELRTEGWIVGLQMAALSMRGQDDISGFIKAFTGSNRFILDYLMEEVLERQSPTIQDFLLRTSVLERMTASLCDALVKGKENRDWRMVTGEGDEINIQSPISTPQSPISSLQSPISSQQILEYLDQSNLFVIPLDNERNWYRYHHLFSDLLRSRLQQVKPHLLKGLYGQASDWCDENDFMVEAVQYALSAKNFERASQLIEENALNMIHHGELTTVLAWFSDFPQEILEVRPWLRIHHAWALLYLGQMEAAEGQIQKVEDTLEGFEESRVDEAQHLKSHILAIRANLEEIRGDRPLAARLAGEALDLLPESELIMRSSLLMLRSFCLQWSGKYKEAAKISQEAVALSRSIGNQDVVVMALNDLAALQIYQAKLHDALATCEKALEVDRESRWQDNVVPIRSIGTTYLYMSRVLLEWNNLDAALEAALKGLELRREWGGVDTEVIGSIDLIRTYLARGALEQAQEVILRTKIASPEIAALQLPLVEAMAFLTMGDVKKAIRVIEERGIHISEAINLGSLPSYPVLAKALIQDGRLEEALGLLERLQDVVDERGLTRSLIETLVQKAMALQKQGEEERAIGSLEEALTLAEPGGFVRTFINEGTPMGKLLRTLRVRGCKTDYVDKLLVELENGAKEGRSVTKTLAAGVGEAQVSLVEPLTERELQVLRLLRTDLSAKEIADELFVAVSTVRSHIKRIYSKLDVHTRLEAISAARDLGLIKD